MWAKVCCKVYVNFIAIVYSESDEYLNCDYINLYFLFGQS